jgi:hypothetical protein
MKIVKKESGSMNMGITGMNKRKIGTKTTTAKGAAAQNGLSSDSSSLSSSDETPTNK